MQQKYYQEGNFHLPRTWHNYQKHKMSLLGCAENLKQDTENKILSESSVVRRSKTVGTERVNRSVLILSVFGQELVSQETWLRES